MGMITIKGNISNSEEEKILYFLDSLNLRGGYEFLSEVQ